MVTDAQDDEAVLGFLRLVKRLSHDVVVAQGAFVHQFVLDEDQRLHRVLQCELVLAHLGKNCTNVEVYIAGVRHLQALIDCLLSEVQVVVLDLERLLQVR